MGRPKKLKNYRVSYSCMHYYQRDVEAQDSDEAGGLVTCRDEGDMTFADEIGIDEVVML